MNNKLIHQLFHVDTVTDKYNNKNFTYICSCGYTTKSEYNITEHIKYKNEEVENG